MSSLVWFRADLRTADNPALAAALALGEPIVPVFLFTPGEEGGWAPGGASRWWLHESLTRLDEDLRRLGSRLTLRRGTDSLTELRRLAEECGASAVFWNRRYEPALIARDQRIKVALREAGLDAQSFNGTLLREPWQIRNKAEKPFQVFTAFWRHCNTLPNPEEPLQRPAQIPAPAHWPPSAPREQLQLVSALNWTEGLNAAWIPGRQGAEAALQQFLSEGFEDYDTSRDRPDQSGTSRLSPYLHFGEISAREVWHAVRRFGLAQGRHLSWRESKFLSELGWREFAYHLLYHFPHSPLQPLQERFAAFPWRSDPDALKAWQRGATGYPIVDAGMRQLWRTGWMHNRVRMIAASFLVKDLLLPWECGARWFWDTLVDADLASNTLGWQWVAGCGADAAPYFRVFNPVTQAIRFDPQGDYVRRWIPELTRLPNDYIHQPWNAPAEVLSAAGLTLGRDYPHRLIDHDQARIEALAAHASLRQ
jgi:deoxyribodipyrimidine photo-lyase